MIVNCQLLNFETVPKLQPPLPPPSGGSLGAISSRMI
jgi:hypothetical protein